MIFSKLSAFSLAATLLLFTTHSFAEVKTAPEHPENIIETASTPMEHQQAAALHRKHAEHHKAMAEHHRSLSSEYEKVGNAELKNRHTAIATSHETLSKEHENAADTQEMQGCMEPSNSTCNDSLDGKASCCVRYVSDLKKEQR